MTRARRPPRHGDSTAADLGARVIVTLAAFAVAIWVWPRVTGFTTDSESYLDVVRSLLAGDGLRQHVVDFWRPANPDPLGLWPPLYPIAAAALGCVWPLETAARLVSVLATTGFALAFHALAARALQRGAALLVTLLAVATPGVAYASGMAWSESLYMCGATVALAGLAGLDPGVRRRGAPVAWTALLCGLAAGLAALTRYIGLLLLPVGLAWLLARRATPRTVLAWTLGAAGPPLLWAARGLALFGKPFGPGLPPAHEPLGLVLHDAASALRWSLLPWPVQNHALLAVPALLVIAFLLGGALARRGVAALAATCAILWMLALVVLRSRWTFNLIGERYVTPMLPLVWLACASVVTAAGARLRYVARAAAVVAGVVLVLGIVTLSARLRSPEQRAERAARAAALAELRRLVPPGNAPVLSDVGHLVRSATGRSAVEVPALSFSPRPFDFADLERWRRAGVQEGVFRSDSGRAFEDRLALEERLGGFLALGLDATGTEGWVVIDRSERFVRVRLGE